MRTILVSTLRADRRCAPRDAASAGCVDRQSCEMVSIASFRAHGMSIRRDGCEAAIDELLSVARREALMLAIATSALDDDAAAVAAARLRWAIDAARPLVATRGARHAEQLDRSANRAQRWLVDEPLRSLPELARLVDRAARRD